MAQDFIHNAVKNAIIKDGWIITDDPLKLVYEELRLFADLGAERTFAASRGTEKIAVEIKSFRRRSSVDEFEDALGQYNIYRDVLTETEPERHLFLAIDRDIFSDFFQGKGIQFILRKQKVSLLIIDIENEEILEWIKR